MKLSSRLKVVKTVIAELAQALKEGAKVSDTKEIKELSEDKKTVVEPDIELAKNDSLDSLIAKNCEKVTQQAQEVREPILNKQEGKRREVEVSNDLNHKYPEDKGYKIESEVFLKDENGKIVKDPVTGEGRRLDFVVTKDGKIVDSVEVTPKTADKTEQSAKEERIRANGGNYIKDSDGNLLRLPDDMHTRIERRN